MFKVLRTQEILFISNSYDNIILQNDYGPILRNYYKIINGIFATKEIFIILQFIQYIFSYHRG